MLAVRTKRKALLAVRRPSILTIFVGVLAASVGAAEGPTVSAQSGVLRTPSTPFGGFHGTLSRAAGMGVGLSPLRVSQVETGDRAGTNTSPERPPEIRRMTLDQVKQQIASASGLLARLGPISVEKARQHRLGVQADYFPKIGATFVNLHYSDFLGQVITVRRPLMGTVVQAPVPLFSQNQTAVNVSLIQPITPLLQVHQAVQIARADEQIARAKAAAPRAANTANIEETYFKLLIAQHHKTSAEWNLRPVEQPSPADAAVFVRATVNELEPAEAKKALVSAVTEVRELTASLNRLMGWPDDTQLELVPPAPLVENISLREVADKLVPATNQDLVEAEQNVVKARAASVLSKLEYVPSVAAVGGFLFQNVIPLVPSNLGYGGVMVTYNLFDFGKREHAVKEARAQLEMAQIALQLTKAKVSAQLKDSYSELERSRQLSLMAQEMGSSVIRLVNVSSTSESLDLKAARAKVEAEILEADLAHRQAYARLKALMGAE
jgi:outer membrane protein TolC